MPNLVANNRCTGRGLLFALICLVFSANSALSYAAEAAIDASDASPTESAMMETTSANVEPSSSNSIEEPESKPAFNSNLKQNPSALDALGSAGTIGIADNKELAKAATSQGVSSSQYMNLILGLLVILGFIFLVAWLLRRVGGAPTSTASAMKVVGAISLGSRDRVVLLQVGEKQILVGSSPGNINLIQAFDEPVIDTESTSAGSDFYQKLQASLSLGAGRSANQGAES